MKTKTILVVCGLILSFFTHTGFTTVADFDISNKNVLIQEGLVVYAVYDGKEDYGYNFVIKGKDGMEHTLTFQKVNEDVLKTFNLNADDLVGTKFKITFNKEIKVTKDADGNDDEEEVNTITGLEKI